MTDILLAANATLNADMTPLEASSHLKQIASVSGYHFNPLQSRLMGRVNRSVFKILIGHSAFKLVWHNNRLIYISQSAWAYGSGYSDEIVIYPRQN